MQPLICMHSCTQVALVTFATYALVNLHNPDQRLTADKAFVALSLFNILRFPLAMLPALSSTVIQGYISVKRLRAFLKADELDSETVEWTSKRAMGNIYYSPCIVYTAYFFAQYIYDSHCTLCTN